MMKNMKVIYLCRSKYFYSGGLKSSQTGEKYKYKIIELALYL